MSATILVVDDNYINLELACDVLGCEGHSVLRAHDAQSAQKVLKHTLPDLIQGQRGTRFSGSCVSSCFRATGRAARTR